jgi:predicted Zn-dependent protease
LKAAQSAFDRSAHLPHDRWVTHTRTSFLVSSRRFSEAIAMLKQCIEIDPYAGGLHARLAWALHLAGEARESVDRIGYALEEYPKDELTKLFAVLILAHNGQTISSLEVADDLVKRCPYLDAALSLQAYAQARAGLKNEARAMLEHLEWLGRERFVLRAFTPAAYIALGEQEAAIAELRVSDQLRCPWFFQVLADPNLNELRHRSDFQELEALLPQ